MDAVIFDLFGTLIPNLSRTTLGESMRAMAAVLGAEAAAFEQQWRAHFPLRMNGQLADGDGQFLPIARALGLAASAEQLARATALRREYMLRALAPKPGALACLAELRDLGLKLALASDCSSETPQLLDRTPLGEFFSIRACSAHLGVTKPDAAIYRHALAGLGVAGDRCVYVGDGNSEELPGAKRHGMTTIWIDNGEEQHWKNRFVPQGDYTVQSLPEILAIVKELRGRA